MIRVEAWLCLLMGLYGVVTGAFGKNPRAAKPATNPKPARTLFVVAGAILVFLGAYLLRVR